MSSSKEMAENYLALGQPQKAEKILNELANNAVEYATWYLSLDDARFASSYETACVISISWMMYARPWRK